MVILLVHDTLLWWQRWLEPLDHVAPHSSQSTWMRSQLKLMSSTFWA